MKQKIISLILASALIMSGCGAKTAETGSEASTEMSKESTSATETSFENILKSPSEIASEESSETTTATETLVTEIEDTEESATREWNSPSDYTYQDCQDALAYIQYFSNTADKKRADEYYTLIGGTSVMDKETAADFIDAITDLRIIEINAKDDLDSEIERLNQKYHNGKDDPYGYIVALVRAFNTYKETAAISDNDIE